MKSQDLLNIALVILVVWFASVLFLDTSPRNRGVTEPLDNYISARLDVENIK